jgi:hypothetical protein
LQTINKSHQKHKCLTQPPSIFRTCFHTNFQRIFTQQMRKLNINYNTVLQFILKMPFTSNDTRVPYCRRRRVDFTVSIFYDSIHDSHQQHTERERIQYCLMHHQQTLICLIRNLQNEFESNQNYKKQATQFARTSTISDHLIQCYVRTSKQSQKKNTKLFPTYKYISCKKHEQRVHKSRFK